MKKTTKFLLVLAAVVAMTIGAVSTVMAADYPVIAAWGGNDKDGWTATDADGKDIIRGWATYEGDYYYFSNKKMAKNSFIRTNNQTYFVDNNGRMCTGWNYFKSDYAVSYNGAGYKNIAEAFLADIMIGATTAIDGTAVAGAEAFKTAPYKDLVWCYFGEDGAMVINNWVKDPATGIWYYMDGPFCLMDTFSFKLTEKVNGANKDFWYGFDASGAMLAGWIAVPNVKNIAESGMGPNYKPASKETNYTWTYYTNEGKQAPLGWLKDADGDWFYMVADAKAGAVAVSNTYFTDKDGTVYYFDDACYMATGEKNIYGGSGNDGKNVNVLTNTSAGLTTGTAINVAKNATLTLSFNENGGLLVGMQGDLYYEDAGLDKAALAKYTVGVKLDDAKKIVVTATEKKAVAVGTKYTDSFILIDKDGLVRFYDCGVMVKSDTVVFGDKVLAFNDKGVLVGGKDVAEVKVVDTTYIAGSELMEYVTKNEAGEDVRVGIAGVYYSVVKP